ncbi:hypothetical protein RND81_07G023400 [Saponaria officinalis]|uniref:Uncharacterized protein n=1 Tax=Saponaria officinalis TaxID=3572 RepID=A0AAW1JM96_SAPOF
MNFTLGLRGSPPKFRYKGLYLFNFPLWQEEKNHHISHNSLDHRLDKYLLPRFDNIFSFHPLVFFQILSFSLVKIAFLDLQMMVGRPRYFPCLSTSVTPNTLLISPLHLESTFLLNIIFDLEKLIFCPEVPSYLLMMSATTEHSLIFKIASYIFWFCEIIIGLMIE